MARAPGASITLVRATEPDAVSRDLADALDDLVGRPRRGPCRAFGLPALTGFIDTIYERARSA
jgi:hypothetical protein